MATTSSRKRSYGELVMIGAILSVAGVGVAGCSGHGAGGTCPLVGDCGGDPQGSWRVTSSCSFPVSTRPLQNTAPPETGVPGPPMTSGSWCWDLSFDATGAVTSANGQAIVNIPTVPLLSPNPDVVTSGTITFNPDHTYLYLLDATSTTQMELARSCLGVNAANMTCGTVAEKLQLAVDPTKYSNFVCAPTSGGCDCSRPDGVCPETPARACAPAADGCSCSFVYSEPGMVGDNGRWVVDGNEIIHYSVTGGGALFETSRTVREATFCVHDGGQTLELSGARGTALALKTGLRGLTLTKM